MTLCDRDCNHCPLILHKNSRLLTVMLNRLQRKFGGGVYGLVQTMCPNLTVCSECRVDDFVHVDGCELDSLSDKEPTP